VHFETGWQDAANVPASKLEAHMREMLTRWDVTSVWDLGSDPNNTMTIRRRVEAGEVSGPKIPMAGAWLTGPVPRKCPERNWSVSGKVQTPAGLVEDTIPEDQSLVLNTPEGLVLVTVVITPWTHVGLASDGKDAGAAEVARGHYIRKQRRAGGHPRETRYRSHGFLADRFRQDPGVWQQRRARVSLIAESEPWCRRMR